MAWNEMKNIYALRDAADGSFTLHDTRGLQDAIEAIWNREHGPVELGDKTYYYSTVLRSVDHTEYLRQRQLFDADWTVCFTVPAYDEHAILNGEHTDIDVTFRQDGKYALHYTRRNGSKETTINFL